MTGSIPFWEDWRFWQIVTTGALALLGFTVGTWIKYWFDLRRDDRLRRQETEALMRALASEMQALAVSARGQAEAISKLEKGAPPAVFQFFGLPQAPIFERNADKIGWLPDMSRKALLDTINSKETVNSTLRMLVAHSDDTKIDATQCADMAKQFNELAGAAVATAKVLRLSKALVSDR